jgi:hypothetical protein
MRVFALKMRVCAGNESVSAESEADAADDDGVAPRIS